MRNHFKLLRITHYVKNFFIFAPLFFAFSFHIPSIISTSIAFGLFSLLASSIYIFNDICDLEEDRKHPSKKNRPLANGSVSVTSAVLVLIIFSISSLTLAFLFNFDLFIILLAYFILNLLYSIKLKHISLIDLFIIAVGFVLRLFAGASVIKLHLSPWIIIMTFLLALFLAAAKRRDDVILAIEGNKVRKNIDGYNFEFVNSIMVFMSGVIVVAYILYTLSPEITLRLGTNNSLFITTIFVILGIFRYMQLTFVEQKSGSPIKTILTDVILQLTTLFWLLSFWIIFKFG